MAKYIVNKRAQNTGEHEVHNVTQGCDKLPFPENRQDLGFHDNCQSAVKKAKQYYDKVDGCSFCTDCHTI